MVESLNGQKEKRPANDLTIQLFSYWTKTDYSTK